jgi:predicted metalloprotease
LLVVLGLLFGVDPSAMFDPDGGGPAGTTEVDHGQDEIKHFVGVTLADTEDVWNALFSDARLKYREPRLIVFDGRTDSACGFASAATGPFYCPEDETVYLDLDFFRALSARFGAPGDYAMAVGDGQPGDHYRGEAGPVRDRLMAAMVPIAETGRGSSRGGRVGGGDPRIGWIARRGGGGRRA